MLATRPDLGVRAEFLRYYVKTSTGKPVLSKYPIYRFNTIDEGWYRCRENVSTHIRENYREGLYNSVTEENDYTAIPCASKLVKGKLITLDSTILLRTATSSHLEVFQSEKTCKKFGDLLDYIVGITGVCLSHEKDERDRRKVTGKASSFSHQGRGLTITFSYYVLSPFWITSPVLVSIVLGLARDSMASIVDSSRDVEARVLDRVDKEEIHRIINEVDYDDARKVFKKVILPFFSHLADDHIRDNPDSNSQLNRYEGVFYTYRNLHTLKLLVDNNSRQVFKVERMNQHWDGRSTHYGLFQFAQVVKSSRHLKEFEDI